MQSLMGEPPLAALAPQDRLGVLSVGELNSPTESTPLHRWWDLGPWWGFGD
ncbi:MULTISPECIES: hypothetical protein [unclassified Moorena]|uniref:hypothetical protein n=1 Tax=unclassified Moorena TaxID=2683338 RepID=UPI00140166FF|nr:MULTISPECIES: hypothetical protein [unclassified Moorena]NEO16579.1 hypothetical protein [Moorena sp. SIO3E8]NEQ03115.1 hypothetical protein [Moorena sp. SIO3F7]